jgi:hypothetical protein
MKSKNLQSVTGSLSDLAATMPTQRPLSIVMPGGEAAPQPVTTRATPSEPLAQFSFSMRRSLRRELDRLAADSDVTMRAFVLDALKAKGLAVTDDDLLDLRKQRADLGS